MTSVLEHAPLSKALVVGVAAFSFIMQFIGAVDRFELSNLHQVVSLQLPWRLFTTNVRLLSSLKV